MKNIFAAVILALSASAAVADVVTYDCSLHRLEKGWISERVILSVDAEEKRARAYDAYIHDIEARPKDVKFKTTRKGEYRMLWKMKVTASNGQRVYVNYTATLNPETRQLNLIARFPQVNATNRPKGIGPCKILRGESLYAS